MQRYFVDQKIKDRVYIAGDDAHHIRSVMRMKEGHKVSICDDNGNCYLCELDSFKEKNVVFNVVNEIEVSNELECEIYLACGLLKGDKFDYVIQKATELGVSKIIPLDLKRNIVKLDSKKFDKKLTRWQKIAKEAAEQSKRNIIPTIDNLTSVDNLMKIDAKVKLIAYEQTNNNQNIYKHLQKLSNNDIIIITIGPEGGFDQKEVDKLLNNEFKEVSLGKRILRAETACIHSVGIISSYIEYLRC